MPSLTRAQTVTMAKNQVGETLGSPGSNDPIEWTNLVLHSADLIAQETGCYMINTTFDAVKNQSTYSSPTSIYQIISAKYFDNSLTPYPLSPILDAEMDDRYATWVTYPSATPRFLVTRGLNTLILSPPPDTTSLVANYTDLVVSATSQYQMTSVARPFVAGDAGYVILISSGTGWTTGRYNILTVTAGVAAVDQPIGTVNSTGGTGEITNGGVLLNGYGLPSYSWTTDGQTNPLPLPAHMATMFRAALMRAVQFPEENARRIPHIEREYKAAYAQVEKSSTKWTSATRRGVRRRFPFGGGH